MDWKTALQNPFFTVALPIVITMIVSVATGLALQNKRFDDLRSDMNRQFDEVNKRLDRIDAKLEVHGERIAKIEGPGLIRRT